MTAREELIQRIERSWDVLVQTFEGVDDERLSEPGEDGGWAAKDHLAHLWAWEGKVLAILEGRQAYEGLGIPEESYRTRDIDGINELVHERTRDMLAPDVVEELRTTHARLMAALATATDEDLAKPYVPQDSTDERRLVDGVVGNTYEHYDEHLPHIQQLLGSRE